MSKKYWLHRIRGGNNASPYTVPLLDAGYLSIGWSDFSKDSFVSEVKEKGKRAVDKMYEDYRWGKSRNRYCLSRFIREMRCGDWVIVPFSGCYSVYEIIDDTVFSNESFECDGFVDGNGIKASKTKEDNQTFFINNQGAIIDLGFYRKVKPIALRLSRYDNIDPSFGNKLSFRMTNYEITDVGEYVNRAVGLSIDPKDAISDNDDTIVLPSITSIEEILKMELCIPIYQRPYIWTNINVEQMLSDIKKSMDQGKDVYRIGGVILQYNNIVDGQQRITTLSLIVRAINELWGIETLNNTSLKFNHVESFAHIKKNYTFIKTWLMQYCGQKIVDFSEYIKRHCEFVVIRITGKESLSMAFKLFDSQNGRGKTLEAYNLLKAFHLRAMDSVNEKVKIRYDRLWEGATRYYKSPRETETYDILKHLFDEQLFRSRIWSKNKSAWAFSKKQIGEFKGMYIDKYHDPQFPFQNKQYLQFLTEKFYEGFLSETMAVRSRFVDDDNTDINPFVNINQPIVNGRNFFDYAMTYVEIYKRLFIELGTYQLHEFKSFYIKYCLSYRGHWNRGDNYVREMYKSLVICLFDKFGEQVLDDYYKKLYLLAYAVRKKQKRVFYQSVARYPQELFAIILNANSPADLHSLDDKIQWEIQSEYNFDCYDQVSSQIRAKL